MSVRTVTQAAKAAGDEAPELRLSPVEIVELPRAANRPAGPRFGALVHAVLASVPLDGDLKVIRRLAAFTAASWARRKKRLMPLWKAWAQHSRM